MEIELALAIVKLFWVFCGFAFNYILGAAIVNDWTGWNLPTPLEIRWK
jgi:hypothetical protein